MNSYRSVRYLLSALVLFGFLFMTLLYLAEARNLTGKTLPPPPYMTALLCTYAVFGGLFGILEHTLGEIQKPGRWRLDLEKLIFLGLPSAFFAGFNYIYFQQYFKLPAPVVPLIDQVARLGSGMTDIAAVMLGYVLVSSCYKKETADFRFGSKAR